MNALALAAVAPAPAAAPSAAPQNGADEPAAPGAFARELQRATPRSSAERRERGERPERAERDPAAEARPAAATPADASAADGSASADPDTPADAAPDDTPPALDLSTLLAGWAGANTATPAATPRGAGAAAQQADGTAALDGATASPRGARGLPATAEAAEATDRAGAALPAGDAQATPHAAVSDAASGFALPTALPAGAAGVQGGAANTSPAFADAARGAAVAERQLDTPVSHPGFAPALGAEVSLLVKDGVQHARLHLNPAEMGPITVQIQIEGERAQVTMAAQQADTRQALEQALPSLAGALRDSGLTLTGGGVFEQPRQAARDEAPAAGGPRGDGTPGADEPADPTPRRGAPRGVVDLYA